MEKNEDLNNLTEILSTTISNEHNIYKKIKCNSTIK